MSCGASMGDGYGPCVVSREPLRPSDLTNVDIAVPGTLTSAFLALRMFVDAPFRHVVRPFDEILDAVRSGDVAAGLIIHEGQLTYAREELQLVVDLGQWWTDRTGGLPLPLGGNLVRKDLGPERMRRLTAILRESIDYGLSHRDEALEYAMGFGRGLDRRLTDRFVGMYVNDLTLDYGERGRRAIERFLAEGSATGLRPGRIVAEFVS
jgi:1,4-dihydroxy-6-naphthoate synthase